MRETHVCVIDENGETRWQGRCRSVPEAIVAVIRTHAPAVERIALETGPLATWHWHALKEAGLPVVCLHARHAKAALSLQLNKTDTNDAHGLAQLVRSGWYREVAVKSLESHRLRAALTARARLVTVRTALYNQLRGTLNTFGVLLKPGRRQDRDAGHLPPTLRLPFDGAPAIVQGEGIGHRTRELLRGR